MTRQIPAPGLGAGGVTALKTSRRLGAALLLAALGLAGASCASSPRSEEKPEPGAYPVPALTLVKAGSFSMGDEHGDLWPECRPVHRVTLTYDYLLGTYQVTFTQFDAYCDAVGRHRLYDFDWGREDRPVMRLTWWDMADYCNWLSALEGLRPAYDKEYRLIDASGRPTRDITAVEGYRLPTEAEWEYAAMGGHKADPASPRFKYSGSDDVDEVAWYSGNSGGEWIYIGSESLVDYTNHGAALYKGRSTQPVGRKKPNQLGIFDMSGNVWEWCQDWYAPYGEEPQVNPLGPEQGHVRVMRGGSWIFGANDCRVALRFYRGAYDQVFRLGFRVARTATP